MEPKVGMKFGTYLKAQSELIANAGDYHRSNLLPFIWGNNDGIPLFKRNYDLNKTLIHDKGKGKGLKYVEINNEIGKSWNVFVRASRVDNGKQLEYLGSKHDYVKDKDVPFDMIIGEKTYAIDKNKNGIVDPNEIHEIEQGKAPCHVQLQYIRENF